MSDDLKLAEQTVDTAIALINRLMAENKQLRAENERLSADGIHTCHDQCPRYACVLRRERDTALADVERLRTLGDEAADALERVTEERDRLKAALVRLRDCDWVISLPDRMDAVREIARNALEAKE